jgi:capsular polysaccharide biosynthesis protein
MRSEKKRLKILFGVPEGEYIARQFACLAAAMPDAECRFLGFSWCTGRVIRKAGLDFAHIPWQHVESQTPDSIPAVFEFIDRGYRQDTVPYSARRTFGALSAFIEREMERFEPDIVVYGPAEHAICYLMDQNAKTREIPRLGIQTSFIANHFIVQTQGPGWENDLRSAEIQDISDSTSLETCSSLSSVRARNFANARHIWNLSFWLRSIERTIRVLGGGASFDSIPSLWSTIVSKFAPPKWFPTIETLESAEDLQSGCVLVVLHQPSLFWTSPTWVDLITFALEATPEDVPLVIRPHPSEVARRIPRDLEDTLRSRGARISRAFHGPSLATLLQRCRSVLTLTSATGMEALLAGVPVFTLGPAFYARPGLAKKVTLQDASLVREMITTIDQFLPDAHEVAKFANWLKAERMVHAPECGSPAKNGLPYRIHCMVNH